MAKLRVPLKQHTPMIHFQYNQCNASLRGTELKPKLDQFLLDKFFKNNIESYEKYLIGFDEKKLKKESSRTKAFDYKVRVKNIKKFEGKTLDAHSLFFGNLTSNKEESQNKYSFVFYHSLDLEIVSFHKELIEIIVRCLPKFLMHTNFGTRQSKGFGSFFINDANQYFIDGKQFRYDKRTIEEIRQMKYWFTISERSANEADKLKKVFDKIELFYNSMRKGLKRKGLKCEPCIKDYFEAQHIQWDKEAIKEYYFNKEESSLIEEKTEEKQERKLVKDLFGLSSDEKWGDCRITKEHMEDDNNKKIERFPSPIFFKPLQNNNSGYTVYFEITPESSKQIQELLGKTFKINKIMGNEVKSTLNLETPNHFSFDEFFHSIFVEKYYKKFKSWRKVLSIYEEIDSNRSKEGE